MTKNDAVERADPIQKAIEALRKTLPHDFICGMGPYLTPDAEAACENSHVNGWNEALDSALALLALQTSRPDAGGGEQLAQLFHETYERLAPSFGC